MPVFEINAPDGGVYQVEGPDEAGALAALRKMQGPPPQQSATDKLTGINGPRYQTWPERLLRGLGSSIASGATLPGDVMAGKAQLPSSGAVPGSVPFGDPASSGERVADLAGLAAPLSPAARAGEQAIPGIAKVLEKPKAPTVEALQSASTKGFDEAKGQGVALPSSLLPKLGDYLEQQLQSKGILPEHAPTAYKTIERLSSPPDGAVVTISDLHNLRQAFGNAAGNFNFPKDTLAGSMGVSAIDKLLVGIAEKGDVAGAASPATKSLKDAIGNFAAGKRSEDVTGRTDMAALRAKVSNSGQNLDNATRQRFVDIASEGKASRGFNDQEIAQALKIAQGGPVANTARFVGNGLRGGGGFATALTAMGAGGGSILGNMLGHPLAGAGGGAAVGAAVSPIIGALSKSASAHLTRHQAGKLDEMVRQRSPLYEAMLANPGTTKSNRVGIETLVRALMEAGSGARP